MNKKVFKLLSLILFASSLTNLSGCFIHKAEADPNLKIELTPARISRGKYLVVNVNDCMGCHSTTNPNIFGRPVVTGTEGKGGTLFGKQAGFPGELYTKNITPYALKDWTDGEIVRAITEGRSRDGHALFPIMPYTLYGKMSKEDVYSIVAYIRTLKPVKNDIPERKLDFPLNIIVNFMPKAAEFREIPDKKDTLKYGEYMVNAVGCVVCHTPVKNGQMIEGKEFSGGQKFVLEDGMTVYSANITSDKKTGIGSWSKETFISKVKSFASDESKHTPVKKGEFNTIMPWLPMSGMTNEDLGAIYEYIHSVKAIENKVNAVKGPEVTS